MAHVGHFPILLFSKMTFFWKKWLLERTFLGHGESFWTSFYCTNGAQFILNRKAASKVFSQMSENLDTGNLIK